MNKYLKFTGGFIAGSAFIVTLLGWVATASANPYIPVQGGTGTSQAPSAGQVLIGNGSSTYTPAFISCSGGCSVTSASGTITIHAGTTTPTTGGGLATSSDGSYAPGNIAFYVNGSKVSGNDDVFFATSTETFFIGNTLVIDAAGKVSAITILPNDDGSGGSISATDGGTLLMSTGTVLEDSAGNAFIAGGTNLRSHVRLPHAVFWQTGLREPRSILPYSRKTDFFKRQTETASSRSQATTFQGLRTMCRSPRSQVEALPEIA